LIDLGCDVNSQNSDGMTSLHLTMWQDNASLFEVLLKNNADSNIEDNEGESVKDGCPS
jgi:ankyrin repeat protein